MGTPKTDPVERISISLPRSLLHQLDRMVGRRGFGSRSQAVAEMIAAEISEHDRELGESIMTGTITLLYNNESAALKRRLADIQHAHIDEVIGSLHILLEQGHTMEVILVQGPAIKLKEIADELTTCKGVQQGKLHLTSTIIPPIHPLPSARH